MSKYIVSRPIWRRFRPAYEKRAAMHVRRGGCAAIVDERDQVTLLLPVDETGKISELGQWALLSIEQVRWRRVREGVAKGLATAKVKREYEGSVLDWCVRDSVHAGHVRDVELDCLACGACCHDSYVLMDEVDFDRFRAAGREDLLGKAYVKRSRDGRITLRFLDNGLCQHFGEGNRCGIYEIRPDNCRAFVVGSEACLSAREETLKIRDGAEAD